MKKNIKIPTADKSQYRGRGALDAFLNLLSLISLGWLAWAVGLIGFELIYRYLELQSKVASIDIYSERSIKYAIASLIVIGPVYFLVVNLLHLKYKKDELNHNSGIYRWLTYLMLLVSALGIIGSLIALIASFLNGDYSLAVILKILIVLIIAGFIFGYYFYDLRRKNYNTINPVSAGFGVVAVILMLAAAVLGFLNIETPGKTRARLLDSRTEQGLSNLVMSISNNYGLSKKLDDTLELSEWVVPDKNVSVEFITYRKISDKDFELCADFKIDSVSKFNSDAGSPWIVHQAGRNCYAFDATKEMVKYSAYPKEEMNRLESQSTETPPVKAESATKVK